MLQYNRALCSFGDLRIVGDHNQCGAFLMQLCKQVQHNVLVGFIQVTGGFIRQISSG